MGALVDGGTLGALRKLRRRLPWIIVIPAIIVAAAVSFGIGRTIVADFGRMVTAGAVGIASEFVSSDARGLDTTDARARLDQAVSSRVEQGSLTAFAITDTHGTLLYESHPGTLARFTAAETARAMGGKMASRIERNPAGNLIFVAGPTAGSGAHGEGAVLAIRTADTVVSSVRSAFLAVAATVLLGAFITFGMAQWVIARAEREILAEQAAVTEVERRLEVSLADLESHSVGTLLALTHAVDAKDSYTARHSLNVADYSAALARSLNLDHLVPLVERAGLLHDVGKIGVPEAVLLKPGGLTREEFDLVKNHSAAGATIVESIPFLANVVPGVLHHHEHWDGTGYPTGLAEEDIPLIARILAVADAFDAMTSDRPYRKALPLDKALKELEEGAGTQFEADIARHFIALVRAGAVVPAKGLA